MYDYYRPTIVGLTDEAAHRARLKVIGHCFSLALLPDLETVMRPAISALINLLDERRGTKCDMHHLSRYFSLDISGMRSQSSH
jgi:hypothetical protein